MRPVASARIYLRALRPKSDQGAFRGAAGKHDKQGLGCKKGEHYDVHEDRRLLLLGHHKLSRAKD